jgi:hypothetical protein
MNIDWKDIGKMCGQSLNDDTVQALARVTITDDVNIAEVKKRIYNVLKGLRTPLPYTNSRDLAWDLAVVVVYNLQTFPSIMICFGNQPFKVKCRLPDKKKLSVGMVKQYWRDVTLGLEGCYAGHFIQVCTVADTLLYVYSFTDTAGCSSISDHHYNLPVPRQSNSGLANTEFETIRSLGAGNAYIHMDKDATKTEYSSNGEMVMTFKSNATSRGSEDSRTDYLRKHLETVLPSLYDGVTVAKVDKISKKKNETFCFFTGGGDLKISISNSRLLLVTTTTNANDTESGESSPIDTWESRDTLNLECKHTTPKSDADIRLQLQANMYHLVVREFMEKINTVSITNIESLEKLTIYGMSFGTHPHQDVVEVLKLTVDFSSKKLRYEIKYHRDSLMPKEFIIDGCITAVLDRISKRSPSPDCLLI